MLIRNSIRFGLLAIPLLFAGTVAFAGDVLGQATLTGKTPARDAVIFLESADKKTIPAVKAVVDQRDKTFSPHVSVVPVGSSIQFPNNDTIFHNVFAYFDAKRFDLGMYPRGKSKTQRFDKPGLVAVLCNVHSEMSAYIYVVDTPYYAMTDRSGKFRIAGVAPGTYTLKAWHETGAVATRTITVSADGGSGAPLSLTLGRR